MKKNLFFWKVRYSIKLDNPFKSYLVTKPTGEIEYLNQVNFVIRMLEFAKAMMNRNDFFRWAKEEGIPYPCTETHVEGETYHQLKAEHLMRFMASKGYEFEEVDV